MLRVICLAGLVTAGVGLTLTVAAFEAQEERPAIETIQVTGNLWMLGSEGDAGEGMRTGGNTALFVADSGVVLVDTKLEGYGEAIMAEVRRVTDRPVTHIINTHTHFDHSGSNTEFPDTVEFVAHENIRRAMARDDCQPVPTNCDDFQGENAKYLPSTTFSDRLTLFSGADAIDLYHFGPGHTDGDTFIVFRESRAMHTGDMFLGKFAPFIDAQNNNGGSASEFGQTLNRVLANVPDVDTIITGHWHTPLVWSDLQDYARFYNDLVDQARQSQAAGRSADEAAAAYALPDDLEEYSVTGQSVRPIIGYLYEGR
ncbi:MAG: MBL fold metallo-hydrolase [Acidobacteria bacterium]|nr:MBL fold metallo-hydrolase [Acidobacteriota bacterium]